MKLKHAKKTSGFTLVELLVVIAIIALLAALSTPIILRQIASARAATAVTNAKDIRIALDNYSKKNNGSCPTFVTDSNVTLRLLFSAGVCRDEKPFFVGGVQSIAGAAQGDDDYSGTNALESGENVWSYFQAGTTAPSPERDAADTPVLAVPLLVNGSDIYTSTFEIEAFGGQAVVLRTDGSAKIFGLAAAAADGALDAGTLSNEDGSDYAAPTSTGAPSFANHTGRVPTGWSAGGS